MSKGGVRWVEAMSGDLARSAVEFRMKCRWACRWRCGDRGSGPSLSANRIGVEIYLNGFPVSGTPRHQLSVEIPLKIVDSTILLSFRLGLELLETQFAKRSNFPLPRKNDAWLPECFSTSCFLPTERVESLPSGDPCVFLHLNLVYIRLGLLFFGFWCRLSSSSFALISMFFSTIIRFPLDVQLCERFLHKINPDCFRLLFGPKNGSTTFFMTAIHLKRLHLLFQCSSGPICTQMLVSIPTFPCLLSIAFSWLRPNVLLSCTTFLRVLLSLLDSIELI